MICRHCNQRGVNRPRGLCWGCYYTPGVIHLYPPDSKYAYRGVGTSGRKPCEPTTARPGSPEKIAVLEGRAERGEMLFHPDDGRLPSDD
jgi:hypothetical protein